MSCADGAGAIWQSQDNDVELTQSLAKTLARKGGGFEQLLRDQCAESAAGISAVQEARAALDNAEVSLPATDATARMAKCCLLGECPGGERCGGRLP